MHLIECEAELKGNQWSAREGLTIAWYPDRNSFLDAISDKSIIAFEKGNHPVYENSANRADIYLFGGENVTLRPAHWPNAKFFSLKTVNQLCLLSEAAVAVVAYGQNK